MEAACAAAAARLRWELEAGEKSWALEQLLARDPRAPIPSWVLAEPIPDDFTRWIVAAFWALSTERHVGMALGHVPDSAVRAWAEREGVLPGNMALVSAVVRALDSEYLEHVQRRTERLTKHGKGKS